MRLSASSQPRGFTLLELMVVLALVSMVLAMAWPSLESMFEAGKLPAAAQEARTVMREARRLALERGVVYRIEIDSQLGMVRAVAEVEPRVEKPMNAVVDDLDPHETVERTLPIGVSIVDVRPAEDDDAKPPLGGPAPAVDRGALGPVEPSAAPPTDAPDQSLNADSTTPTWRFFARLYPDGSADEAKLTLADTQDRRIEVQLNALAGGVEISSEIPTVKSEPGP